MRAARLELLVLSVAWLVLRSPKAALADEPEKARCAAAYERAQELQRQEAMSAARKQLVICRDACPGLLKRDCTAWLKDVDALMPTLLIKPRDAAGRPIQGARVTVDGELLADGTSPTTPLEVDPGERVLRFEHPDFVPAEVRVTLHGAERDREVVITLWPRAAAQSPATEPEARPADTEASGHRTSAYALGIGGLVALAAGGGIALTGSLRASELRGSCGPYCSQSDADGVVTLWRAGGAIAAVGAIATAVGTYLWFAPRSEPPRQRAVIP